MNCAFLFFDFQRQYLNYGQSRAFGTETTRYAWRIRAQSIDFLCTLNTTMHENPTSPIKRLFAYNVFFGCISWEDVIGEFYYQVFPKPFATPFQFLRYTHQIFLRQKRWFRKVFWGTTSPPPDRRKKGLSDSTSFEPPPPPSPEGRRV